MPVRGTVVKPAHRLVDYLAHHAANKLTKSILAVATPQYCSQLAQVAKDLPKDLQTIVAAVDSVPFGTQRDGFSWQAFEEPIKVFGKTPLRANLNKNWDSSACELRITSGLDLRIPVANTLFETGTKASMHVDGSEPLEHLHIQLPHRLEAFGGVRPVVPLTAELTITSAVDNMLKTLDDLPAASFLEDAAQLTDPNVGSERIVYAQVTSPTAMEFIKVVAGGGGLWSPRSRMLVLEPPVTLKVGDKLKFHLSYGHQISGDMLRSLQSHYNTYEAREGVILESASQLESLDQPPLLAAETNSFFPIFGLGSEQGFWVNGTKHSIPGEIKELV